MSFAGDLRDFTKSFMAGYKLSTERGKANDRAKYYDAMIGIKGAQAKASAARGAASLGLRAEGNRLRGEALKLREKLLPHQIDRMNAQADRARRPAAVRATTPKDDGGFTVPTELQEKFPGALPVGGAVGPQSALPISGAAGDAYAQGGAGDDVVDDPELDTDTPDPVEDDDDDEVATYSNGGAVAHFAGGGAVHREDVEYAAFGPHSGREGGGALAVDADPGYQPGGPAPAALPTPQDDPTTFDSYPAPQGRTAPGFAQRQALARGWADHTQQGIDPTDTPQEALPQSPVDPTDNAPEKPKSNDSSDGFRTVDTLKRWSSSPDKNPIAAALKYIQDTPSSSAIPQEGEPSPVKGALSSKNAPAPNEVEQSLKVVDPKNELHGHAQRIKLLDATYNYYLNKGDLRTAQRVAAAQILHGNQMSQKMGSLAAAAFQAGNGKHAVEYLKAAYDYLPNGNSLDAKLDESGNVSARLLDADGEVVKELGTLSPQQAFKFAMGNVASGKSYWQGVIDAADPKAAAKRQQDMIDGKTPKGAGKDATGEKPMQMRDVAVLRKEVDDSWTSMKTEAAPRGPDGKPTGEIPEDTAEDINAKAASFRIASDPRNRSISPREIIMATQMLRIPNKANPYSADFKVTRTKQGVQVKHPTGSTVFMPQEVFDNLAVERAARLRKLTAADNAKETAAAQPGFWDRAAQTASGVKDAVTKFGTRVYEQEAEKAKRFRDEKRLERAPYP
jgi:hypothetical protein